MKYIASLIICFFISPLMSEEIRFYIPAWSGYEIQGVKDYCWLHIGLDNSTNWAFLVLYDDSSNIYITPKGKIINENDLRIRHIKNEFSECTMSIENVSENDINGWFNIELSILNTNRTF